MPGQNGAGPMGLGPMTGRGMGPCGQGNRNARGYRRGGGFGQGQGQGQGMVDLSSNDQKTILKEELKQLKAEKEVIEKKLNDLK
jgi:hypothetical protein